MDEGEQKIGLGTVQFGTDYGISNKKGQTEPEEVSAILEIARKNNIKIIDTASAYGNAENVLGLHDLSYFKVVSKYMPPEETATITDQLEKSLDHLGIPSLYGYLAHRPRQLLKNSGQWQELQSLKKAGKVWKIGYSLNEPDDLINLLSQKMFPDLIQVPFNYFDRRFRDLMLSLQNDGCEIHARSVFLQGLFFLDTNELDAYFDSIKPIVKQLQETNDNLPSALLNFVLNQPFVDCVIMGVENSNQLKRNIRSIGKGDKLPELEYEIDNSILMPSNWPSKL